MAAAAAAAATPQRDRRARRQAWRANNQQQRSAARKRRAWRNRRRYPCCRRGAAAQNSASFSGVVWRSVADSAGGRRQAEGRDAPVRMQIARTARVARRSARTRAPALRRGAGAAAMVAYYLDMAATGSLISFLSSTAAFLWFLTVT